MIYGILDGHTELRDIAGVATMPIPERTVLLFFKLKAAWDRNYRLGIGASADPEWERGKLTKDRGDIIALLDPDMGGHEVDLTLLGELIEERPFLVKCLSSAANDRAAVQKYQRMEYREVESLMDQVIRQNSPI
jgi:hypothetical protein